MSTPKTLRQMVGLPTTPGPLEESALVLIDCQLEYVTGALPLPGVGAALKEAGRVLELARGRGVPVFHVVHHGRPGGGAFDPQGPLAGIAPEVAPRDGEPVIVKSMPNAFTGTELDEMLRKAARKELIVVGFMTHLCVASTVRAACELGYRCTVVAGAAATRDLPDGRGGVVTAAELHRAELAALSDRFSAVVESAESLED